MTWYITQSDIPYLSVGAKMLGCGGGGDTTTAETLLYSVLDEKDRIMVCSFLKIQDDEFVVPIAMIGSPVLYSERIPSGDEGVQVLELYEQTIGRTADALISLEAGGMNALIPLIIAAQKKLPVVDGDGMGRTFPELNMCIFHLMDIQVAPAAMINGNGQHIIQYGTDNRAVSSQARKWVNQSGGVAHIACYGATGSMMKTALIPGTLYVIYRLGYIICQEQSNEWKLKQLQYVFTNSVYGSPTVFIEGRIEHVERNFVNGTVEGKCLIQGKHGFSGSPIEIRFQNEYLSIQQDGWFVLTVPDLIVILHAETFYPCSIDDLYIGIPVLVFGVPAPNILRTREMLAFVGPEVFGLPIDYSPLDMTTKRRDQK